MRSQRPVAIRLQVLCLLRLRLLQCNAASLLGVFANTTGALPYPPLLHSRGCFVFPGNCSRAPHHLGVTRWNNPTFQQRSLRALSSIGRSDVAIEHAKERFSQYLPTPANPTTPALIGPIGGPLPEYWCSRIDVGVTGSQVSVSCQSIGGERDTQVHWTDDGLFLHVAVSYGCVSVGECP